MACGGRRAVGGGRAVGRCDWLLDFWVWLNRTERPLRLTLVDCWWAKGDAEGVVLVVTMLVIFELAE